jgi:broad specificity phosphatase PhoE
LVVLVAAGWLRGTTQVIASAEAKAVQTAEPIASALGVSVEIRNAMHENDRTATGFLRPEEFEVVADQFFAHPDKSIRGWECAKEAQQRIMREAEAVLSRNHAGDVLFVGHGAVGTLLYCYYANIEISRMHDQPPGGGHYFTISKPKREVLHRWRRMEEPP